MPTDTPTAACGDTAQLAHRAAALLVRIAEDGYDPDDVPFITSIAGDPLLDPTTRWQLIDAAPHAAWRGDAIRIELDRIRSGDDTHFVAALCADVPPPEVIVRSVIDVCSASQVDRYLGLPPRDRVALHLYRRGDFGEHRGHVAAWFDATAAAGHTGTFYVRFNADADLAWGDPALRWFRTDPTFTARLAEYVADGPLAALVAIADWVLRWADELSTSAAGAALVRATHTRMCTETDPDAGSLCDALAVAHQHAATVAPLEVLAEFIATPVTVAEVLSRDGRRLGATGERWIRSGAAAGCSAGDTAALCAAIDDDTNHATAAA